MIDPIPISHFSDAQRELWACVVELWELSKTRDETLIQARLHPRYVGWDMSTLVPHDRDAAVRSVTSDSFGLRDFNLHPLSVQIYAEQVGVVHYTYAAQLERDAQSMTVTGKWSEVYLRQDSGWVMISVAGKPDEPGAMSLNGSAYA